MESVVSTLTFPFPVELVDVFQLLFDRNRQVVLLSMFDHPRSMLVDLRLRLVSL